MAIILGADHYAPLRHAYALNAQMLKFLEVTERWFQLLMCPRRKLPVMDTAQNDQRACGADCGQQHIFLGIPDITLQGQKIIRGCAANYRDQPFKNFK